MQRLLALSVLLLAACVATSTEDPSLVGRAEAVINQVPSSVGCIQISAAAATVRTVSIDTTPGQTVTVQLTQLPIGSVTFSALGFAGGCASVTPSSVADWSGSPVVAHIAVGQVTQVALVLEPSGSASVGISFDSDGGTPDLSQVPDLKSGCVPSNAQCAGLVCGLVSDGCGGTISCGFCAGKCCGDSCAPKNGACP